MGCCKWLGGGVGAYLGGCVCVSVDACECGRMCECMGVCADAYVCVLAM